MFDFEKLKVYQKAKGFHKEFRLWQRKNPGLDSVTRNQLKRAALSVPLNIAEGTGRFTKPDRRNFYVIARSSIFECVAIADILKDSGEMTTEDFEDFYREAEELSKMLFAMIRRLGGVPEH